MSVLGKVMPDPIGMILGTKYQRFESATRLHGLMRVSGPRLDILAVVSQKPGSFKRFIAAAKKEFMTLCIWEVWNKDLPDVLRRYGFREVTEKDVDTDEILSGWRFDAITPNTEVNQQAGD